MFVAAHPSTAAVVAGAPLPNPIVPPAVMFGVAAARFGAAERLVAPVLGDPTAAQARDAVELLEGGLRIVRSTLVPGISRGDERRGALASVHARTAAAALVRYSAIAELDSVAGDRSVRERTLRLARTSIAAARLVLSSGRTAP